MMQSVYDSRWWALSTLANDPAEFIAVSHATGNASAVRQPAEQWVGGAAALTP
jgi:hypothetical protein